MIKLLIISDTHGDHSKIKLLKQASHFDYVIHAGDYGINFSEIVKLTDYVVSGNNDFEGKQYQVFQIQNFRFLLIHGHQVYHSNRNQWHENLVNLSRKHNINVVIYGHSHCPFVGKVQGVWIVNPGSLNYGRGMNSQNSYVIGKITTDLNFEIKYIS